MLIRLNHMRQPPLWCFKPQKPGQDEAVDRQTGDADADKSQWLVCVACEHRITTDEDRLVVNDRHEHTFMNPHAFAYHIGCFARAPGAFGRGPATLEVTWFPGYAWQLAHCGGCGAHMGWLFRGDSQQFYGLIVDRLVRRSAED